MLGLGPFELAIVFMMVIVLFGAKRLPELARSLGRSIKEFKHATQDLKDELDVDKIGDRSGVAPQQRNQPQAKDASSASKEDK